MKENPKCVHCRSIVTCGKRKADVIETNVDRENGRYSQDIRVIRQIIAADRKRNQAPDPRCRKYFMKICVEEMQPSELI